MLCSEKSIQPKIMLYGAKIRYVLIRSDILGLNPLRNYL